MIANQGLTRRRVILAELNEITWRWLQPLCAAGKLPNFAAFVREGASGSPVATEVDPHLDPWVSWTSLYTGRPQEEHGVYFLEQPPETVGAPRVWDLAADAGRSVGLFGSIMCWPPRTDVRGFWVPGTFSPAADTFPSQLRAIQEFNLSHTRAHCPAGKAGKVWQSARLLLRLIPQGLRLRTLARVGRFLVRSRLRPERAWEKVSYQPLINLDFFEKLYRQHQPDLATFHTNHVAHYQHRFWRYADPAPFLAPPSPEDCRKFGPSIEFGYQVADEVLGRLWKLADANTVVVVASGLGQQPYVKDEFPNGRLIWRFRDINQILQLCGLTGHCTPLSMMAPQWNLRIPDPDRRARAERIFAAAWAGSPATPLFAWRTVGDTICVNPFQKGLHGLTAEAKCCFAEPAGQSFTLGELCASQDATPKQGYHDPVGLVIFRGAGIRAGARLNECSNLDLAPTILHLLGIPIPATMRGRELSEMLLNPPRTAAPAVGGEPAEVVTSGQ